MKPFAGSIEEFFAGEGLFETFLVERGRIVFAREHLARLRASAAELGFPPPPQDEQILTSLTAQVTSAGMAKRALRLNLRLDHGVLSFLLREVEPALAAARAHGVPVITVRLSHDRRERARHKWVERRTLRDAMHRAREAGASEALLIAPDGCLLEGATSNVFCVVDGNLRTPPTDARILPGVTRSTIQAIAKELGIAVDDSPVDASTLHAATEVFLTSAVRMLVPVVSIDGQPVADREVGPLARRLSTLLWQRALGDAA